MDMLGFLVILAIAVVSGFIGNTLMRGRAPYTLMVASLVGLIGGVVGTALLGGWGPEINGVFPLPTTIGAFVFNALLAITLSAFIARPSS